MMLLAKSRSLFFIVALMTVTQGVFAQIEIQDSHGKYRFAKPPERVVVLNWALAEQLLTLGEVPVGMTDIDGYQKHATNQVVPDVVADVGERLAPDFAQIRSLKPDVILIGYSQRPYIRPLSNIAQVIYFKNFGKRYNNAEKSRERFTELAKLFDKSELASDILIKRDARLISLKTQLHDAYQGQALPVIEFVVPDSSNAAKSGDFLLFGENSMPFYAAQMLGLEVVSAPKNDQFGLAQLSSEQLNELVQGRRMSVCRFYFSSYVTASRSVSQGSGDEQLGRDCVIDMDYQNAFGGVMSIQYLAESLVAQLIARLAVQK